MNWDATKKKRCQQAAHACLAVCDKTHEEVIGRAQWLDDGFQALRLIQINNAKVGVFRHYDFYMVAFRGTDELADWKDNLDLIPYGFFVRGFYHHAKEVKYQIIEALVELVKDYGEKPVWFAGHSLGGAAATSLGLEYSNHIHLNTGGHGTVGGIVTFGAPRCLTKRGVEWSKDVPVEITRFRHHNDIVCRIPKTSYHPDCEMVYIDRKDRICINSRWRYRLQDRLSDFCLTQLVADHPMKRYHDAIRIWNVK